MVAILTRNMEDKKEIMIDLTYLKTFSDGDLEFVKEMVELFIDKIPAETTELRRAVDAKEWTAVYKAAHDLKSSANFIGLKELIESIVKMEDCAKNERNLDAVDQLKEHIIEHCLMAVEELKEIKIDV